MTKRIAEIISALFHPIFLPVYFSLLLIANSLYNISSASSAVIFLVFIVFTTILPLLSVFILQHSGWIGSFTMQSRNERSYPLLLTLLFNVSFLYITSKYRGSPILNYVVMITAITIILSWGINIFTKLSLHLAGWSALMATAFWFLKIGWLHSLLYVITAAILTGIIGSARLKLKAHNGIELVVGTITGIISLVLTNYLIFRMA